MNHTLELRHLGPIDECTLSVNKFTVLTGPQSNGKSTIAKSVFFFRSVKQDILNIMMQGGPKAVTGRKNADWQHTLTQHMRDKFLQLFGTSWIMPDDMTMKYTYTRSFWIKVSLVDGQSEKENYIDFEFSPDFEDYMKDLDEHSFQNITSGQKLNEEQNLEKKLDDPYETVFIPAGRNLITLLSAQLNYIFTSLEGSQLRNIDYVTKRYTELILKIKPLFEDGMSGIISGVYNNPDQLKKYENHQRAIQLLQEAGQVVLKGTYRYVDGEERLYLDDRKYVKINLSSSGQQEIVWVFNLMFYYLLEDRKVFLILEEPESHLYPDSQRIVGEMLGLFLNEGNSELITTHSPYMLGTFNYMLLANQIAKDQKAATGIDAKLHKCYWLNQNATGAYHVHDGKMEDAMDRDDGIVLVNNGLIDGASDSINEMNDYIIEQSYAEETDDE